MVIWVPLLRTNRSTVMAAGDSSEYGLPSNGQKRQACCVCISRGTRNSFRLACGIHVRCWSCCSVDLKAIASTPELHIAPYIGSSGCVRTEEAAQLACSNQRHKLGNLYNLSGSVAEKRNSRQVCFCCASDVFAFSVSQCSYIQCKVLLQ